MIPRSLSQRRVLLRSLRNRAEFRRVGRRSTEIEHSLAFPALGTRWRISSTRRLPVGTTARIARRVEEFDRTFSRFRPDSLVAEVRREPGTYRFPSDAAALFALYRTLYECTHGALTPLVGDALEHLGYGPGYRLTAARGAVGVPAWDDVMTIDGATVTTVRPLTIDVGAAGKGFLVDLLGTLLGDEIGDWVVDASGDLLHRGNGEERVGLEDPDDPDQVIGVATIRNEALCASATTRRRWAGDLHHILDPATGRPASGIAATWVVHSSCAVADGLATALFLVEPDVLGRRFPYRYVRLHDDGHVDYSQDFDGELFT